MPEVSRFFGVVIRFHYDDHPPAHFHARYGGHKAAIGIHSLEVLDGWLPPRVLGLVKEWASLHKAELLEDWRLARRLAPPKPIAALE